MYTGKICAVLAALAVGTFAGSVVYAHGTARVPVRTCEEAAPDLMICDDGTTCYMVGGVWVCEPTISWGSSNRE